MRIKTKIIFYYSLLLLISACSSKRNIPETLQNKFDVLSISKNFASPEINLDENHLKEILVLLYNSFPPEEIKEYFQIKNDDYDLYINDLFGQGLIRKTADGGFVPSCMVIDVRSGNQLKKTADSLGREMSLIAIERLEKIKNAYGNISALKNIPFEQASSFIIGDVIYNFWQLPEIKEKFLKAEAPRRGAGRFYLAVLENNRGNGYLPFGLYANRFQSSGNYIAGCYGNLKGENDLFPAESGEAAIVKDKNSSIPLFSREDQKILKEIAALISPDIINYLEKNRTLFVKLYLNSDYKDQTSFREWLVWYYQFMITQANRSLEEKGLIKYSAPGEYKFILLK